MKENLSGGLSTQKVVKIGNTVHRTINPNSPFTHKLLALLYLRGFTGAPRFLGFDDEGMEILTFLEGDVPNEIQNYTDEQLISAAKLIKAYHDATAHNTLAGSEEVVCHNDLTPCNTVFIDKDPKALIDFDAAAPGTRLRDLGYATWQWCNLGNDKISVHEQGRRIKLFLDAYGLTEFDQIIPAILNRQNELITFCKSKKDFKWRKAEKWGMRCQNWMLNNLSELYIALKR